MNMLSNLKSSISCDDAELHHQQTEILKLLIMITMNQIQYVQLLPIVMQHFQSILLQLSSLLKGIFFINYLFFYNLFIQFFLKNNVINIEIYETTYTEQSNRLLYLCLTLLRNLFEFNNQLTNVQDSILKQLTTNLIKVDDLSSISFPPFFLSIKKIYLFFVT